jgi:hypothetical protein
MLLGSYRCTDVPGEFVWQPGVLTQVSVVGAMLHVQGYSGVRELNDCCLTQVSVVGARFHVQGYSGVRELNDCCLS